MDYSIYQNPLISRYASKEMQHAFSDEKRFKLWRKLWVALAEAEKAVIAAGNKADVEILKRNISAFGGGEAYLRGKLYEKVAPNIQQIMSNSAGEKLFGLPVLKKSLAPGRK